MKVFSLISIFFIVFFSTYYCISPHKGIKEKEKSIACIDLQNDVMARFIKNYEELSWKSDSLQDGKKERSNVSSMLRFIEGVCYGDYIDYLDLHLKQPQERRITFDQFSSIKKKIRDYCDCLIFSYEEFCSVLMYSIVLTNIVNTSEYKSKSWIYGTTSLLENIIIHPEIFPSIKQFTSSQMKLATEIIRILSDESFFSLDQNLALLFSERPIKKMVCGDAIEAAYFVYLAKQAGTLISQSDNQVTLSSRYLSQLSDLEKDISYHHQ